MEKKKMTAILILLAFLLAPLVISVLFLSVKILTDLVWGKEEDEEK
jgi:hypothetical protein